jgi:hypothetical protein
MSEVVRELPTEQAYVLAETLKAQGKTAAEILAVLLEQGVKEEIAYMIVNTVVDKAYDDSGKKELWAGTVLFLVGGAFVVFIGGFILAWIALITGVVTFFRGLSKHQDSQKVKV